MNLAPALFVGLLFGCAEPSSKASDATLAATDDLLIVPGTRVGRFVIGDDTLTSILGTDTAAARKAWLDRGFQFEFDRGRELSGVTILSAEYATREGLRVGSSALEVEAALGAPRLGVARDQDGKLALPVLAYDGIGFYLAGDAVLAIWVGKT